MDGESLDLIPLPRQLLLSPPPHHPPPSFVLAQEPTDELESDEEINVEDEKSEEEETEDPILVVDETSHDAHEMTTMTASYYTPAV